MFFQQFINSFCTETFEYNQFHVIPKEITIILNFTDENSGFFLYVSHNICMWNMMQSLLHISI